jgi:tRNA threonylcarbamoyladenosine biosynthesis protein TsaB
MRLAAIDTTAAAGSIALHENGALVEELPLYEPDGFGQVIFHRLRELLDRHSWDIASIGCFAAASGPGSFTGVRIGLAAIKGLAEATRTTAIAVSNLQALAFYGASKRRGVILDARRGEVYAAIYEPQLRAISPEVVMPASDWIRSLDEPPEEIISPDFAAFRETIPPGVRMIERQAIASAVAHIAEQRLLAGESGDPVGIDANYVRRSDAELLWVDK